MAFVKKTWKDRLVEYAGRRKITNVSTLAAQIVDMERAEGVVSEEGSPFNAASMNDLEQRAADAFSAVQQDIEGINSDLGGLNFKEEAGKKYVRGADAVWVPLGSNPYIMGSERMENNIFVPSLESHNRNPTSIAPSTYCTISQPIDLTHINKIIIKIHVTNNTSSTVCKFGLGVRTVQPKSYADCEGTPTKVIWTHGPTTGNLAQIIEYDVSGLAGNYYPFVYHNFPYEVGIFYWKID